MGDKNLQVLLARRPQGWVQESDFRIAESEIPTPGPGQMLVKNRYLSLDPYMRGRMDDTKSYAAGVQLGEVMVGGTVGEVVASNVAQFNAGDTVVAMLGWQQYGLSDGKGVTRVDPRIVPASAYLGVVGMPGQWSCGQCSRAVSQTQGLPCSGHRRRRGQVRLCSEHLRLRCLYRL
jgi:NADPH-dependent curcumin reductase CurA